MARPNQDYNDGAGSPLDDLRDRASTAFNHFGDSAASQVDNAPLLALAGGIALGALLAAVLPQTERETELLQPVGSKVTDAGRGVVERAREAGKAKVDELAGDKVRDFFGLGGSTASGSAD